MLRKYFVEGLIWLTLIAVLIGSVVMTYKVRFAIDTVNNAISNGAQVSQTQILSYTTKDGKSGFIFGYAKVREDLKGRIGWVRPEINGDGFYICIYDKD